MNTTAHISHTHGDPAALANLTDADLLTELRGQMSTPPATTREARELLRKHASAGTRIAYDGCANPCPRAEFGCIGFDPQRGCGGYVQPSTW